MNSTRGPARRRRIISTSGLTLTVLLLFLPFVGVSCESGMGTVNAEISGWDMAVGGEPSVSRTGLFGIAPDSSDAPSDPGNSVPVQPLMVLAIAAILGAILASTVLPTASARALGAGIIAGFAALIIILNQITVTDDLIEEITRGTDGIPRDLAAEWVGTRIGFWLTLAALLLLTAYNLTGSIRRLPDDPSNR